MNNKTFDEIIRDERQGEIVQVDSRESLLKHPERDSIVNLKYTGSEMLVEGDLPNKGSLKSIEFIDAKLGECKAIPSGVTTVIFTQYNSGVTPVSSYPSSVNTLINARFVEDSVIPSNIKSLKILNCPKFDQGTFKLPNTIEKLSIASMVLFNGVRAIQFKSIPEGVTGLNVKAFGFGDVKECILPSTLKELSVSYGAMKNVHTLDKEDCFDFSVVIPKNVETLYIEAYNKINADSNLSNCSSLKKLVLQYFNLVQDKTIDRDTVIPSSVTEFVLNN